MGNEYSYVGAVVGLSLIHIQMCIRDSSYTEGAQPVHWSCDGGTEYDIQEGNKNTIGTEITPVSYTHLASSGLKPTGVL